MEPNHTPSLKNALTFSFYIYKYFLKPKEAYLAIAMGDFNRTPSLQLLKACQVLRETLQGVFTFIANGGVKGTDPTL